MRIPTFIRPQIAGFVFTLSVVASMAVSGLAHAETQFTIGAIPDTQQEVVRANDTLLPDRYTWLVNNRSNLNLKYLTHSGDVVNWGNQEPIQFVRASDATNILDGSGIPYAYALGNHDTGAVAVGGSAALGNTRLNLRNTEPFNNAFPLSRFKNVGGTYELGKVDNLYQTFSAGGIDWLNITLEMWPRQGVVDWAKQVVTSHPHHNVIITTHAFADATGVFPTTGFYDDTTAQSLWNQLVSQYPNIKMVISGHYRGAHYSERTGVNGNKIPLIMTAYHADYQNHVRLLTVNTANGTISSRVYVSTSLNGQPNGEIVDQYSNFVTTGMNWIQPENSDPQPPVITAPDAPTGVTATAGNASATVSFTAPANNGGSPITGYTVTSSPGNLSATGTSSPITVTGLTNGLSYSFTVKAHNAAGSSIASFTSSSVTPTAPAATTEHLTDGGFETGTGGWTSFLVGNLSQVTTPVRSGTRALSIAAVSSSTNWVGMTNNSVITNTVAGRQYTAQCYVGLHPAAPVVHA